MDQARGDGLAGAGLAGDKNRKISPSSALDFRAEAFDWFAIAWKLFKERIHFTGPPFRSALSRVGEIAISPTSKAKQSVLVDKSFIIWRIRIDSAHSEAASRQRPASWNGSGPLAQNHSGQIPNRHQARPLRLLALHRDRDAGLRAGAGGFDPGAHPERAEHLRPGGGAAEARTAGPARLPRLQGGARPPAHPRLDLERAHPAVPQGPDREREPRGDRVSRRSSSWPAA